MPGPVRAAQFSRDHGAMLPFTELDAPYSADDAEATPWEAVRAAIESSQLFWISTVRADGRPHVTPLVAVWLDDALHFSTGPLEQKAVNLRHNDRVALTTGCNDGQSGLDIVVEGRAVRVTDDAELHRLADAWRLKWDGFWDYEVRDGQHWQSGHNADVFRVAPDKVLSFDKTAGAASRHRFDAGEGRVAR